MKWQHSNLAQEEMSMFWLMQLLYSPLISCAGVQEWKEAPTELSSISIYKNFLVICGLSHACNKDIFHSFCFLPRKSCLSLRAAGILL